MIALFPLEGWAMGHFGLARVYPVLGLLLAFATLFIAARGKARARAGDSAAARGSRSGRANGL